MKKVFKKTISTLLIFLLLTTTTSIFVHAEDDQEEIKLDAIWRVEQVYNRILNIDYRTIDASYLEEILPYTYGLGSSEEIDAYIAHVKKYKILTTGTCTVFTDTFKLSSSVAKMRVAVDFTIKSSDTNRNIFLGECNTMYNRHSNAVYYLEGMVTSYLYLDVTSFCLTEDINNIQKGNEDDAIYELHARENIDDPGTIEVTINNKIETLVIPESIDGKLVTSLGSAWAREDSKALKSLSLPKTLREFSDTNTFRYCKSLEHIKIDSQNPYMKLLDGIIYSADGHTLLRTTPLFKEKTYSMSTSVTVILPGGFSDADSLESVSINPDIQELPDAIFNRCTRLNSVSFGDNVTKIGDSAFSGTSLTHFKIPDSVFSLGSYAFSDCPKLEFVEIGKGLKYFLPSNSTTSKKDYFIDLDWFCRCKSLSKITVDKNNEYYCVVNGILFDKEKEVLIKMPQTYRGVYHLPVDVIYIASGAIADCPDLTDLYIYDGNLDIPPQSAGGYSCRPGITGCDKLTVHSYKRSGEQPLCSSFNTVEGYCSGDRYGITIPFEPIGQLLYNNSGVYLEINKIEDPGLTLKVITPESPVIAPDSTILGHPFTVYDISLEKAGSTVQPTEDMKVKLPIPNGYDANSCAVYQINADGSTKKVEAKLRSWYSNIPHTAGVYTGVYLVFPANNLSTYAVVVENKGAFAPGDPDNDGQISVKDVLMMQKAIAAILTLTEEQALAADINKDGQISVKDVLEIQKYIAKLIPGFDG